MLISTMNDLPGYQVTEVLGEVFGLIVRSRNAVSQMGSQIKSIFGGELKDMTQALVDSRHQVIERMVEEASAKGADAILAHAIRRFGSRIDMDRDLRVRHRRQGAKDLSDVGSRREVR